MKRFIVSCFVVMLMPAIRYAAAQDFKIAVQNDEGEPLPYIYISVNGQPRAQTDDSGTAYLSLERLREGDTVSAACIGTGSDWVVYDKSMNRESSCVLTLAEVYGMEVAKKVTVQPDLEAMFKKYTRPYIVTPIRFKEAVLSAEFTTDIQMPDSSSKYRLEGSFTQENDRRDEYLGGMLYSYRIYCQPAEIRTDSDTVGMDPLLRHFIYHGLSQANAKLESIRYMTRSHQEEVQFRYGYLGKKDECRIFRILGRQIDGYSMQLLFFADENTREIRRMEMLGVVNPDELDYEGGLVIRQIELEADVVKIRRRGASTSFVNRLHVKTDYLDGGPVKSQETTLGNMQIRFP